LHAGYGRIPVLSGINFKVAEHEVIGVLGHNGMGKTTLLKTLIGQVPLTGGSICFGGVGIGSMPSFGGRVPAWAMCRKAAPYFPI
jgi:urea transport system ATP-binding protein